MRCRKIFVLSHDTNILFSFSPYPVPRKHMWSGETCLCDKEKDNVTHGPNSSIEETPSETAHKGKIFSWVSEEVSTRAWSLEPPAVNRMPTHLWRRAMWSTEKKDLETTGRDSAHM